MSRYLQFSISTIVLSVFLVLPFYETRADELVFCANNGGNVAFRGGEPGSCKKNETEILIDVGPGPAGPQGPQGEQGSAGADGMDGMDGAQGPQGPPGTTNDTSAATECGTGEVLLGEGACLDILPVLSLIRKIVFVSSIQVPGGILGEAATLFPDDCSGLATAIDAADCICQQLADPAGLFGTFRAWLTDDDDNNSPNNRFVQSTLPYLRTDGIKVADDFNDLTDGDIQNPINISESGLLIGGTTFAWTNTASDGTRKTGGNCDNWTDTASVEEGQIGNFNLTDDNWTDVNADTPCTNTWRLLCFEQ